MVVAYAVELGVKVKEDAGSRREEHGVSVKGAYLHVEEWDIRWREYQLNNSTGQVIKVLIEHPRRSRYDLFESADPKERTDEHYRFEVEVPVRGESTLRIQERRLVSRKEELHKQSWSTMKALLQKGLIDPDTYEKVAELLKLWEQINEREKTLEKLEAERQKIYKAQKQIQGNMKALGTQGKEGALRGQYVENLEVTEAQLKDLAQKETDLKAEMESIKDELKKRLA
jgi:hypothetical protein